MIREEVLKDLYHKKRLSSRQIAELFKCSEGKINYWLNKQGIYKRSISDAIYNLKNPSGDPFKFKEPDTKSESFLYGLGLGLYWGEGTKKNKNAVRLGNTDPKLVKYFIKFLEEIFNVRSDKFKFGLQVFSDMDPENARKFWQKELGVKKGQFWKVIVTPHRGIGNYREKTKHGVLTVNFNNKKLRNVVCNLIENL